MYSQREWFRKFIFREREAGENKVQDPETGDNSRILPDEVDEAESFSESVSALIQRPKHHLEAQRLVRELSGQDDVEMHAVSSSYLQELVEHVALSKLLEERLALKEKELATVRYKQSHLPLRIKDLRIYEEYIRRLEVKFQEQDLQIQTLSFLKSQLTLRNKELAEEVNLRMTLEEQAADREHALQTITFLRSQLKVLKQEAGEARGLALSSQREIDSLVAQVNSLELAIEENSSYEHLLDEERIYSSLLEGELVKRDRQLEEMRKEILLRDEQLATKDQEIGQLHQRVTFLEKALAEVKSALLPLKSLIFRDTSSTSSGSITMDSSVAFLEDAMPREDPPEATDVEGENGEQSTESEEKVVPLDSSATPKKRFRRIRWGKVSLLGMLFMLSTFGSTDLFSHFKPAVLQHRTEFSAPIPNVPELLTFPFADRAVLKSYNRVQKQIGRVPVIVLDPGHGGVDPGCINRFGWKESDFVLDLALRTEKYLAQMGLNVILTRRNDRTLSLDSRSAVANNFGTSLLVSIHLNSHPKTSDFEVNGFSVFYNDDVSRPIARNVYDSALSIFSLQSYNDGVIDGRRFYRNGHNRLSVLKGLNNPGVLVEACFLTHDNDFTLVKESGFRDKLAHSVAVGINDSVGLF